jgi:PPOX class probable F420-dependent enzyme
MSVLPDPGSRFGQRLRRRLRDEQVIWFTAVASDGTPQPNPVWFFWDQRLEDQILLYSRPSAHRVAHIRRRPAVALHFDGGGRGSDVAVLSGIAGALDGIPAAHLHPGYAQKYEQGMLRVSRSVSAFAADYSVPIGVQIRRVRGF